VGERITSDDVADLDDCEDVSPLSRLPEPEPRVAPDASQPATAVKVAVKVCSKQVNVKKQRQLTILERVKKEDILAVMHLPLKEAADILKMWCVIWKKVPLCHCAPILTPRSASNSPAPRC
jgi:hypothetical protein